MFFSLRMLGLHGINFTVIFRQGCGGFFLRGQPSPRAMSLGMSLRLPSPLSLNGLVFLGPFLDSLFSFTDLPLSLHHDPFSNHCNFTVFWKACPHTYTVCLIIYYHLPQDTCLNKVHCSPFRFCTDCLCLFIKQSLKVFKQPTVG